ncbi:MAG: YqgE/AlgH family protein [Pseudomonadota bacterium]
MKKNHTKNSALDTLILPGKLLVAMPYMQDSRFHQSVIYICGNDSNGTMGFILSKSLSGLAFRDLLTQVDIPTGYNCPDLTIVYGGPVDISRGFVLHSLDYHIDTTVCVDRHVGVTSTLEILKALGRNEGPSRKIVALGYVNWTPGQLDTEIAENNWLIVQPTTELLFCTDVDMKWRVALASMGVDPAALSLECGHA